MAEKFKMAARPIFHISVNFKKLILNFSKHQTELIQALAHGIINNVLSLNRTNSGGVILFFPLTKENCNKFTLGTIK
jgi:hypothetical protein